MAMYKWSSSTSVKPPSGIQDSLEAVVKELDDDDDDVGGVELE